MRWMNGFEEQPFSSQRLRDGEMFDYLLPVRGYSVEELLQMEEERIQKEKELQEKREQEEKERIKREEEEAAEAERLRMEEEKTTEAIAANATLANFTGPLVEDAVVVDEDIEVMNEDINGDSSGSDEVVHKVYTLKDGTPVILVDAVEEQVDASEDVNVTELETFVVNGDPSEDMRDQTERFAEASNVTVHESSIIEYEKEEDDDDDDMFSLIDFEMFQDLDWHEEVGEDGKELRLSEQLSDEVWEEEVQKDEDETPLSYEEYTERAAEIIEAAQNEILETAEILNAAPGSETILPSSEQGSGSGNIRGPIEPVMKRTERKESRGKRKYDQTRLDGISQLWGLPPEDPSALEGYPEPVNLDKEEYRFEGISQLWGETPEPPDASADSSIIDNGGNFAGISQLWGDQQLVGTGGDGSPTSKKGTRENGESPSMPFNVDTSVYSELEWFDEVGPDGQEYRLSEMLADEHWDDEESAEDAEPISFEDFAKQVEDLREAAMEEKLEAEAILQAPPGADSWDDPHYDRKKKDNAESSSNKSEVDDSLEALEMDREDLPDTEIVVNDSDSPELGNNTATTAAMEEAPTESEIVVFKSERSDSSTSDALGDNEVASLEEEEDDIDDEERKEGPGKDT